MTNKVAKGWWTRRIGNGPWPVEVVAFHDQPHFEEIAAYVMIRIWGRELFPGIENARVEFWTNGRLPEEFVGMNADQVLSEKKVLPLGTCRGTFDEHGTDSPSCAHLVAEVLGIREKTELQMILNFCKRVDSGGKSFPLDPHSMLKCRWDACEYCHDLPKVFDWMVDGVHDFLLGQIRFAECEAEFGITGKIIEGPIKIVTVQSDNRMMSKWIRWKIGKSVDFVIQRRSSGNTHIFSTPYSKVDFGDVVRIVRMQELIKRKLMVPEWRVLEVADDCPECQWWHYSKNNTSQLLNGPLSAPDVEPTVLSLRELAGCVAMAASHLFKKCDENKCRRSNCDRYRLGLFACRQKRFSGLRHVVKAPLPLILSR